MKKIINQFLTALSFMSRVPVNLKEVSDLKLNYFPLVGLLLAGILITAEVLISMVFPLPITALLLLIIYVYLTGALHLDGLGDFADGFFAGRDRDKTTKIMHDSNSGIFALVTLILILGLKYLLFKELLMEVRFQAVLIMAVLPRYLLGFLIIHARAADSSLLAASLKKKAQKKDLFYSSLIFLFIVVIYLYVSGSALFYPLIISIILIMFLIFYLADWSRKKLGGLTGDIYGTIIELGEVIFLLVLTAF